MSVPSDDLPRSPTGRVPQWVRDEATGQAVPVGWSTPPPPQRRDGLGAAARAMIAVVVIALVGVVGVTLAPGVLTAAGVTVRGINAPRIPAPTPALVALGDEAFLTDAGRDLLYLSQAELLGAADFAGRCDDRGWLGASAVPLADGTVGCYWPDDGSIVVYRPDDERLHGSVVETVAHEVLHAAWDTLTRDEQAVATALLAVEVAALDPADPVHEQIAGSVGDHPEATATEHFAYLGTQVWRDGGLDPQLERLYARFVADRGALVGVHTAWTGRLDDLEAEITAAQEGFEQRYTADAQTRAQHAADTATVQAYRELLDAKDAEVAALAPAQRERVLLSWTWHDGTELPMAPAATTLAAARALLARDDADLAARAAPLAAAEAELAAEEARVTAMVDDYNALITQLDPTVQEAP